MSLECVKYRLNIVFKIGRTWNVRLTSSSSLTTSPPYWDFPLKASHQAEPNKKTKNPNQVAIDPLRDFTCPKLSDSAPPAFPDRDTLKIRILQENFIGWLFQTNWMQEVTAAMDYEEEEELQEYISRVTWMASETMPNSSLFPAIDTAWKVMKDPRSSQQGPWKKGRVWSELWAGLVPSLRTIRRNWLCGAWTPRRSWSRQDRLDVLRSSPIEEATPCYKQFLPGLEEPEKSADAEKSEILHWFQICKS